MAARNIKLTIHYDGSGYHGWQHQPDMPTIQGEITNAIEKFCSCRVLVTGSSRTDAGVSALGQVANIKINTPIPTRNFPKALSLLLPDQIAVAEAVDVPDDFNAISSTKSKLYRYTIYTGQTRPVLHNRYCWHRPYKLDTDKMDTAAKLMIGKEDFKSFAAAADQRENSIRTIFSCNVIAEDKWIYINVSADGFLYNMVRNIVGVLIEIGRNRWSPDKITDIIAAKDRTAAGPIAPAKGLCLMKIDY